MRKRINLKLTSNEDIYTKQASRANFISGKMFNENLFAINRIKEELVLNRPIYVGMAILDLSKLFMYDFHYNYMLKKYDRKKIKLMFTDTDSLFYEIKTDEVYEDLLKDKELFDYSDYPKNSAFFFDTNKKVIGKMKDEAAGMVIKEFIGLRSKMYSYGTAPKFFSKIEELTEDTIEDIKKCERLKEYTINKITASKSGSVLDDSIFEIIERCKKLKETTKVKKYFIYESKKCRGISKYTVNKGITIDDYRDTLLSSTKKKKKKKKKPMKSIKSHNHIITSSEITKCSLSCSHSKTWINHIGI